MARRSGTADLPLPWRARSGVAGRAHGQARCGRIVPGPGVCHENGRSPQAARHRLHDQTHGEGVTQLVSPHWLRHAHGSHALDRGATLAEVQSSLGHANVATTSGYLHGPRDRAGLGWMKGFFVEGTAQKSPALKKGAGLKKWLHHPPRVAKERQVSVSQASV